MRGRPATLSGRPFGMFRHSEPKTNLALLLIFACNIYKYLYISLPPPFTFSATYIVRCSRCLVGCRVLKEGRSALNTFSKENELAELREELQEGLYEVNRIRGEWKDLSQPTSFANALFDNDNSAARSSPAPATTGNGDDAAGIPQQQGGGAVAGSGAAHQQQQQQQWQEGAAPQQAAPRASSAYTEAASRSPPPPAMSYGAGASFVAGSVVSRRAAAALHASPEERPSTAPRASATNNSTAAKST